MKLNKVYNLENLKNRSAELVFARVEKLLEENNELCQCEDCVLDLIAYTLNHVTPLYGTSLIDPLHPNRGKEKKYRLRLIWH